MDEIWPSGTADTSAFGANDSPARLQETKTAPEGAVFAWDSVADLAAA